MECVLNRRNKLLYFGNAASIGVSQGQGVTFKQFGVDGICSNIMKVIATIIVEPLVHSINLSLLTGTVPKKTSFNLVKEMI